MRFNGQQCFGYDHYETVDGLPAGMTAAITRRNPRLPYEAVVDAPDGRREYAADTAEAARDWVIREISLLADGHRLARLCAATAALDAAWAALDAVPDPGVRVVKATRLAGGARMLADGALRDTESLVESTLA